MAVGQQRKSKKAPRAVKKDRKMAKPKGKEENKVLLVAQEIKLAKMLAGNDKKTRDKAMRSLKRWLTCRSASTYPFSEADFMRLWKGLFYCVWMSDKPLIQEELCDSISQLLECFSTDKMAAAAMFYKCFLRTMADNWFGIDQHRIDKFLMLVRRMTRSLLRCCERLQWAPAAVQIVQNSLEATFAPVLPTEARMGLGLQMHLTHLWLEEVAKISEGSLEPSALVELCRPFAQYLSYGKEPRLAGCVMRDVFTHLMRQTDAGIDYHDKLFAWRNAGFPGGSIDAMERVSSDEEEDNNDDDEGEKEEDFKEEKTERKQGLDARAGHVDAVLPQLPVDGMLFSAMFKDLVSDPRSTACNRVRIKALADNFETLSTGVYPFKVKGFKLPGDASLKLPKANKAAAELQEFVDNCRDDDELKGLNKRQRRKVLMQHQKLLEAGLVQEGEDDLDMQPKAKKPRKDNNKSTSGEWDVEDIKEDSEEIRPESSKNVSLKHEDEDSKKEGKRSKKNTKNHANKKLKMQGKESNEGMVNGKPENESEVKVLIASKKLNILDKSSTPGKNKKGNSLNKSKMNGSSIMVTPKIDASSGSNKMDVSSGNNKIDASSKSSKMDVSSGNNKMDASSKTSKMDISNGNNKVNASSKSPKMDISSGSNKMDASKGNNKMDTSSKSPKMNGNKSISTPNDKKNPSLKCLQVSFTPLLMKDLKLKALGSSTPLEKVNKQSPKNMKENATKPICTISTPKSTPKEKKKSPKNTPTNDLNVSIKINGDSSIDSCKKNDVSSENLSKIGLNNDSTPVSSKFTSNSAKKLHKKLSPSKDSEVFIPIGKNQLRKMSPRFNISDSNIIKAKTRWNAATKANVSMDGSGQKKVMIALKKNTSQGVVDYFKSVKQSPEIPFDSDKKPLKTSLKPNAIPSPINPFYKKKLKLNF